MVKLYFKIDEPELQQFRVEGEYFEDSLKVKHKVIIESKAKTGRRREIHR